MALSAYFVEDPITRIVSITIGVGRAVVVMSQYISDPGDPAAGKLYVGKPGTSSPQEWSLVLESASSYLCQSYALMKSNPADQGTPTYLVGGAVTRGGVGYGEIYYSNDGENWSTVHSQPNYLFGNGFTGLVWSAADEKFYAMFTGVSIDVNPSPRFSAQIFSSPTGTAWAAGALFQVGPDGNADDIANMAAAATAAFRALCTKPENRGGIPDGFQAYDEANKIFMKPATLTEWNIGGPQFSSYEGGIVIEKDGVPQTSGSLRSGVYAVSFANRLWNLVAWPDPTEIYLSADDGGTWTQVFSTSGGFPAGISSAAASAVENAR